MHEKIQFNILASIQYYAIIVCIRYPGEAGVRVHLIEQLQGFLFI